ncbi:hypothetical protein BC833DRAFT_590424 [Globomyces pollinis-pini]|nr:hypothetical protein BC833DRAFT_590424 [Globomyces pollinis-pini]
MTVKNFNFIFLLVNFGSMVFMTLLKQERGAMMSAQVTVVSGVLHLWFVRHSYTRIVFNG